MVSILSIINFFAFLSFFLVLRAIRDYRRRRGLNYPPGPRPLPIIGNLLHIPKEHSWLAYAQFSKIYGTSVSFLGVLFTIIFAGDVLSFHVFGQVIIILNSVKANKDLLEKRAEIYSDRPVIPFFIMCVLKFGVSASKLIYYRMGWKWFLMIARHGEPWRQGRKVLDRSLGPHATAAYRSVQEAKARMLLTRMLGSPHELAAHIELSAIHLLESRLLR